MVEFEERQFEASTHIDGWRACGVASRHESGCGHHSLTLYAPGEGKSHEEKEEEEEEEEEENEEAAAGRWDQY